MPGTTTFRKRMLAASMRSDSGSAMVEFAVTASVFFMTLVGLMKICLAVYTYHYVSEAARETVRYAIVHGSSSSSPVSTNASVQTYARAIGYPGINSTLLTTTTTWDTYPTAGATCTPSAACNNPGDLVKIKVSYAFPFTVPFMSSQTLNMSSTASMVIAN
ncbi:MAG TPA: TadE family protein [Acidobacteriaceae bacterium]